MALTEEEKHSLQITEAYLKNQTAFFPMIATFLLILVSVSVYFYHAVEKWDWLDSIYFVVVTMATVGYGDFTPTQPISKIYTIFLILIGIATFTAFATQLIKRQGLRRTRKQLQNKKIHLPKN